MSNLLLARDIIDKKLPELKRKCDELTKKGLTPKLSVILVGDNSASKLYVRNKSRFCDKIGAKFELIELDENVSEVEFLGEINRLNNDGLVTGCFVQLPVPKHLAHIDITQLIDPIKDVDGFHLSTVTDLYQGKLDGIIPCTPKGIVTLLEDNKISIQGSNIVIIGRSHIVGKPLSLLLNAKNATVTLCHSKTKDLAHHTKGADIIISAVGIAHYITKEHLNDSKNQIIVDVGMNKLDGKTVGDVHFEDVKEHCGHITPVPGGVGPMTVFSLMENILKSTENILNRK
jgi:methylenetetrahydrofolate dehydrogenase (NADP+)/methenyltetrahydrofolate cyclohydrolase